MHTFRILAQDRDALGGGGGCDVTVGSPDNPTLGARSFSNGSQTTLGYPAISGQPGGEPVKTVVEALLLVVTSKVYQSDVFIRLG